MSKVQHGLAERVLQGDVQAAARLITLIEDEAPEAEKETAALYPRAGQAQVIGITGAPGVGKSTLADNLIRAFRRQNKTVGVVAIDPTSPRTGGALLGDRVRMQAHSADTGVFIRSLATRGWVGGLAKAAVGAVHVMDAMGKDVVFIETVGSGQVEVDIVKAADTTILVLSPGAGDEIQTMKAGILEAADILAVNKADKEGATCLKTDLESMLAMKSRAPGDWLPPVLLSEAVNDKGTEALVAAIKSHFTHLTASGELALRRRQRLKLELMETVEGRLKDMIGRLDGMEKLLDDLQNGKVSLNKAAQIIMKNAKYHSQRTKESVTSKGESDPSLRSG